MCYFRKGLRRDIARSQAARPAHDEPTQTAAAENEMVVQVLSVEGQPTFNVPIGTSNIEISDMVANRYGWKSVGVRHTWVALTGKGARARTRSPARD